MSSSEDESIASRRSRGSGTSGSSSTSWAGSRAGRRRVGSGSSREGLPPSSSDDDGRSPRSWDGGYPLDYSGEEEEEGPYGSTQDPRLSPPRSPPREGLPPSADDEGRSQRSWPRDGQHPLDYSGDSSEEGPYSPRQDPWLSPPRSPPRDGQNLPPRSPPRGGQNPQRVVDYSSSSASDNEGGGFDENFTGQVHPNQHEFGEFMPLPGDVVIRKIIDQDSLDYSHNSNCTIAISDICELYKDQYYTSPRCTNHTERDAYLRLYFRNGDHVIRRGKFSAEHHYEFRDDKHICVYVYWPGFHVYGPFVRLISSSFNHHPLKYFEEVIGQYRCRAQSYKFPTKDCAWENGDFIVRHFDPGPPGAPNPGWYKLLGIGQKTVDSQYRRIKNGDLLIKSMGRPEMPPDRNADENRILIMSTRLEVYCFVFSRDETNGETSWTYLCGDSYLYNWSKPDDVLRLPIVNGVPAPADVMISLDEEFIPFSPETEIGGYVKFFQNPQTTMDPMEPPPTIVYHPTRVPATGASTSPGPPPNLPEPAQSAAWLDRPAGRDLPVPLPEAARPLVLRFGRWAEETDPRAQASHKWIWYPHVEMFSRHPRSSDGKTFFLHDRTRVNYGEGRDHPQWEEFNSEGLDIHDWIPKEEFEVLQGDVIIRRDLRHTGHPYKTRGLLTATNHDGDLLCCPGDLLVRYGLMKDHESFDGAPANPPPGTRYHFGVELYVLILDKDFNGQWMFRGRDQVVFGSLPKPKAAKLEPTNTGNCRLQGFDDGAAYWYASPQSLTRRVRVGPHERPSFHKPRVPQPVYASSSGEGDGQEHQRKRSKSPKKRGKMVDIRWLKRIRPRVRTALLMPKFPGYEIGNYENDGYPEARA